MDDLLAIAASQSSLNSDFDLTGLCLPGAEAYGRDLGPCVQSKVRSEGHGRDTWGRLQSDILLPILLNQVW